MKATKKRKALQLGEPEILNTVPRSFDNAAAQAQRDLDDAVAKYTEARKNNAPAQITAMLRAKMERALKALRLAKKPGKKTRR
jgi:hypothetical protein